MNDWILNFDGFDPTDEGRREALCVTGNGYVATRGAAPWASANEVHYPGTYVAGVYNRLDSEIGGHAVEHESVVNLPNWLPVTFRIGDGPWFDTSVARFLSYRQRFDLRHAVLWRELRVEDESGRRTLLRERRFAYLAEPHLVALEVELRPENWSGDLTVEVALDGTVTNGNVAEDRLLANRHLEPVDATNPRPDVVCLAMRTSQSQVLIAEAARSSIRIAGEPVGDLASTALEAERCAQRFVLQAQPSRSVYIEKVAAVYTSRDSAISDPESAATELVARAERFGVLLQDHRAAWRRRWGRFATGLEAGPEVARTINLHTVHLLQSVPPASIEVDAGVTARGLHGEGYRGHVFWDELFIFPTLTYREPALTESLLRYRSRRLAAARHAARDAGFAGAMFPWQSGSDGRDETPRSLFNPRSGRWMRDNSHLQRHVGLAVAYNVWQYYQVSGDLEFLASRGAELIIEIARFWASIAEPDPADGRYHIRGVMGPDEFHDAYPEAAEAGVDDNAYTNVMAAWVLCRALDVHRLLANHNCGELWEALELRSHELEQWDTISTRLSIPFSDGVISQFAGYDRLTEFDWDGYRRRYGDIARLDLILEMESDTTNRYKLSKQADVLMLFFVLSAEELRSLLERLGYRLDAATIRRTIDYYSRRTSHGSTLCRVAHAWVLARADRHQSWRYFNEALGADVAATRGATTAEGIHLGAMAASLDLLQRCYLGLEARDDALWFNPVVPEEISGLQCPLHYRGHWLDVDVRAGRLLVASRPCDITPISVVAAGEVHALGAGEVLETDLA
jgi:trehalose/maltose hydrolase-like predicted phosphorylase